MEYKIKLLKPTINIEKYRFNVEKVFKKFIKEKHSKLNIESSQADHTKFLFSDCLQRMLLFSPSKSNKELDDALKQLLKELSAGKDYEPKFDFIIEDMFFYIREKFFSWLLYISSEFEEKSKFEKAKISLILRKDVEYQTKNIMKKHIKEYLK